MRWDYSNINVKPRFFFYVFLLVLLFSSSLSSANSEYYADITIDVDSSGFITIDGNTNYPDFVTHNSEQYTSKDQMYWLLNITVNNTFDFVYELLLPESSEINYLKSSGQIRIQDENGRLKIRGYGVNETLSIVVQYLVKKSDISGNNDNILGFVFIGVGILLFCIALLMLLLRVKKDKNSSSNQRVEYHLNGLSERQKEIMELLIREKRSLTQTEIQKKLGIPKSAVSRNIAALELKSLIEKETIGMSNLIRLKKQE